MLKLSSQDKNKVSEQLQSLKTQISTLRRAIQKKRSEHMQSAAEHERLAGEIEAGMDWLTEREAEARSRPLLGTMHQGGNSIEHFWLEFWLEKWLEIPL